MRTTRQQHLLLAFGVAVTSLDPAWAFAPACCSPLKHHQSPSAPLHRPFLLDDDAGHRRPGRHRIVLTSNAEVAAGRLDEDLADDNRNNHHINGESLPLQSIDGSSENKKPSFPVVLWQFTRPHTIIGSALAIPSLHLLAAPTWAAAVTPNALMAMVYAMVPALLMNLYITGLNQITDIEIDKVNKPHLPLAAGTLRKSTAIAIVLASLVLSLGMGLAPGAYSTQGLNVALWGSGILGTLYSLPPVRLKRFPIWAAFCIVAVRGAIINASFFAHAQAAAYGAASSGLWHCLRHVRACALSSLFFGVFGLVIALMKDVPDVVGDRLANVKTFSVRLGQGTVFRGMQWLLTGLFWAVGGAFGRSAWTTAAASWPLRLGRLATGVAALLAGWSVRRQAVGVNPEDSQQVYDYYMHLWKLFYLSYFVLPFAR